MTDVGVVLLAMLGSYTSGREIIFASSLNILERGIRYINVGW